MTELRASFRTGLAAMATAAVLAASAALADPLRSEPVDGERVSDGAPEEVLTLDEAARLLRVAPEELADLAARRRAPGRRIGSEWRFGRRALQAWLAGVDSPEVEAAQEALREQELATILGRGPDTTDDAEPVVGEEPDYETAEHVFLRDQRVLLRRGEFLVEPALFYSRASYTILGALAFGEPDAEDPLLRIFESRTIDQNILTAALVARYGLLDETELHGGILYEYQRNPHLDPEGRLGRDADSVIRGVLLGARRTLVHERRGVPDVVLAVDGRIPVLHSSYAVRGGLWVLKSFDPVVLMGGLQYERVFSRDFGKVSRLEPEDTVGVRLGYVFAVNDDLSLGMSVSGIFEGRTEFSEVTLERDEEYNLRFALTGRMGSGRYVEPSVTFGLNGPGLRMLFGLRFPFLLNP